MKTFWQITLSILLILSLCAGVLWGILTFFPPAATVPEYAQIAPEKLICGMENHYSFSLILPLDDWITSAEISLPENVSASKVHKEMVKWKFDRAIWRVYGSFRVLDDGTFPGGHVELKTAKGEVFTVKIPAGKALILPDESAGLSIAPLPEDPVENHSPFPWKYVIALALTAVIAGIVILTVVKHRKKVLPPWAIARKEVLQLNRMVQNGEISPETGTAGLADAVKNYLLWRMKDVLPGVTSAEFLNEVNSCGLPISQEHRIFLTGFCNCADMVKFAGKKVERQQVDNFAFEILEMISELEAALQEEKR